MAKNDGNGYTIKEMIAMVLDNQDKSNEKSREEFKRVYDKIEIGFSKNDGINNEQDKKIEKNSANIKNMMKIFSTVGGIIVTGIITLFSKVIELLRLK